MERLGKRFPWETLVMADETARVFLFSHTFPREICWWGTPKNAVVCTFFTPIGRLATMRHGPLCVQTSPCAFEPFSVPLAHNQAHTTPLGWTKSRRVTHLYP